MQPDRLLGGDWGNGVCVGVFWWMYVAAGLDVLLNIPQKAKPRSSPCGIIAIRAPGNIKIVYGVVGWGAKAPAGCSAITRNCSGFDFLNPCRAARSYSFSLHKKSSNSKKTRPLIKKSVNQTLQLQLHVFFTCSFSFLFSNFPTFLLLSRPSGGRRRWTRHLEQRGFVSPWDSRPVSSQDDRQHW